MEIDMVMIYLVLAAGAFFGFLVSSILSAGKIEELEGKNAGLKQAMREARLHVSHADLVEAMNALHDEGRIPPAPYIVCPHCNGVMDV